MKRLIICAISFIIFVPNTCKAQLVLSSRIINDRKIRIAKADENRHLVADFPKIASLKIISRKNVYSINEMMNLDVALLVKSDVEYNIPTNLYIDVKAKRKAEETVYADSIVSVDYLQSSFKLMKNGLVIRYTQILLGNCEKEVENINQIDDTSVDVADYKGFFDFNFFRNLDYKCLGVNGPEEFEIWAELSNRNVVVSKKNKNFKTAVGTLISNKLKIKIR